MMDRFLYFIEGYTNGGAYSPSLLVDHGLEYALAGPQAPIVMPIVNSPSPSGGNGLLLHGGDEPIGYKPKVQTWLHRDGKVWVGVSGTPTEESLRRNETIPGYQIDLADGAEWTVPLIHVYDAASHGGKKTYLPCIFSWTDGRWVEGDVIAKHRKLYQFAKEFFDAWHEAAMLSLESGRDQVNFDHDFESLAVKLLQVNYKLGICEASMLGLFSTNPRTASLVAYAACHCYYAWLQMKTSKKNELDSDGSNTSHGSEGSSADSSQPLPT